MCQPMSLILTKTCRILIQHDNLQFAVPERTSDVSFSCCRIEIADKVITHSEYFVFWEWPSKPEEKRWNVSKYPRIMKYTSRLFDVPTYSTELVACQIRSWFDLLTSINPLAKFVYKCHIEFFSRLKGLLGLSLVIAHLAIGDIN